MKYPEAKEGKLHCIFPVKFTINWFLGMTGISPKCHKIVYGMGLQMMFMPNLSATFLNKSFLNSFPFSAAFNFSERDDILS